MRIRGITRVYTGGEQRDGRRDRENGDLVRLKRILVHDDSYLCRKSSSRVLCSFFFSACTRAKGDAIARRALGNTNRLNAYCRAVDFFVRAVLYLSPESDGSCWLRPSSTGNWPSAPGRADSRSD